MKKKILAAMVSLTCFMQCATADIDIMVPSEIPGQFEPVPLHQFIAEHRYTKASKLRTISDTYRNLEPSTNISCQLASAYELAALLAGDSTLLSWANRKFGTENIEKFLQDELDMQEAIFNSLATEC